LSDNSENDNSQCGNSQSSNSQSGNSHNSNSHSDNADEMKRRDFLKAAVTAAVVAGSAEALSGCSSGKESGQDSGKESGKDSGKDSAAKLTREVPEHVSETQAKRKKQGRSTVAIVAVENYERDIFAIVKEHLKGFAVPDLKGQTVVLKPNMVEFRAGKPVTTNPAMLQAAILLAADWGAKKIIVAEGPGHMRDTEYLLEVTGLGPMCKKMDVPFVDLNLDEIEEVENKDGFTNLEKFYLPRTIVHADAVISVPKLKTHHWVGVTCSMKNFFGTVPGRKYGWPKNLLHIKGIPHSIIDLQHLVKPRFAIVDAITCMEGDGPINGVAKHMGFVVLGSDLAAVDATCVRMLKLNPSEFPYIRLAGKVVGNIDEAMIDVSGPAVATIAQTFEMPKTFTDKSLLSQAAQQGS